MFRLRVKTHIDSAHYIGSYPGKCSQMHGHRWDIEAVLEGSKLDYMNMVADFAEIKACMRCITDGRLDHQILNDVLVENNMTAEYLSKYLFEEIDKSIKERMPHLERRGIRLSRVAVWESPECCAEYYHEGKKK